ncbi:PorV/PorQ family protein [candidate division KSB1 bacterium]|nr:PorV/PorQ family protein [candidate division KSB1 bacterium]
MKFSGSKKSILFLAATLWVAAANIFLPTQLSGQTQSGATFLKVLPGARQQGLAGSLTGAIDETYALYANPGAVGFLREWQWSAGYTEWIADIFNASLIYGKQVRLRSPWSDRVNFALGIHYQGIREFDSSRGAAVPASAKDVLVTASLGSPISVLSRNIALGLNIKYFRSELAQFSANALVFDVGLLYRTPRFRLSQPGGFFDYGILSAGVSANHLGTSMKFLNSATPLPRTLRAGLALNLGTHDGLQLQLALDYKSVRDEDNRFSFGAEITNLFSPFGKGFGRLFDLRGGYNFDDNLLSKLSVGLSVRLDDYMLAPLKNIAPRNTSLRMDMGVLDGNEFFAPVYRGSITHQPIVPEKFEFVNTEQKTFKSSGYIKLSWQATVDPDLYDDVAYLVMVANDSLKLDQLIKKAKADKVDLFQFIRGTFITQRSASKGLQTVSMVKEGKNGNGFYKGYDDFLVVVDSTFSVDEKQQQIDYTFQPGMMQGDYFWTAMAYDRNHHIRFAEKSGSHIAAFQVEFDLFTLKSKKPDLTVRIDKTVKTLPPPRLKVNLPGISFAPDSANVDEKSEVVFWQWVDFIKRYPHVSFEISGHTDNTGPPPPDYRKKYNQALSQRRAENVVKALVAQGIDADRLKAMGYGDSKPLASTNSSKAWAKNRRVEIGLLEDNRPAQKINTAEITYKNQGGQPAGNFTVTIYDSKQIPEELRVELVNSNFSSLGPVPKNGHDFSNILRVLRNVTVPKLEPRESATIEVRCDEERPYIIAVVDKDDLVDEIDEANNWILEKITLPERNLDLIFITSNKVAFAFDSYQLTHSTKEWLNNISKILRDAPLEKYEIAGHTDSQGPEGYNMYLSLLRAQSVKSYLVSRGIESKRLSAQGYGEGHPLDLRPSKEAWVKNRRVEIKHIEK